MLNNVSCSFASLADPGGSYGDGVFPEWISVNYIKIQQVCLSALCRAIIKVEEVFVVNA